MRCLLFLAALILAGLTLSAQAECLPSARAVRHAHPASWATWRNVHGKRCWMARSRVGKRKHAVRIALPRPRPAALLARDAELDALFGAPAPSRVFDNAIAVKEQPR